MGFNTALWGTVLSVRVEERWGSSPAVWWQLVRKSVSLVASLPRINM